MAKARATTAAILWFAAACATTDDKQDEQATAAPVEKPPEVAAHALCETMLEVDDAIARGQRDEKRKELSAVALQDPTDAAARFGVAMSMETENDRWQAFKGDGQLNPESVVFPLGECFVYAWWKMADQQTKPCDEAAGRVDDLALVDVARGELLRRDGKPAQALARYDAALATDARCVPALIGKARAQAAAGDAAAARATYKSAQALAPDCFLCAQERAAVVEDQEGKAAARPLWKEALALQPDHAPTVRRYAATQVGHDDKAALAAYEKAISLGVEDRDTLVAAARLAEKMGALDRAAAHAKRAAEAEKSDVKSWRLLAELNEKKGDAAAAGKAYKQILELVPDDWAAHLALARAAKKGERLIEALTHYEAATRALEEAGEDASQAKVAANTELGELLRALQIPDKGSEGTATRVVSIVQSRVRKLYEAARKKERGLKGTVEVVVVTREDGTVKSVKIKKDGLKNATVAAALVGNLQRARIVGGAKRYSFELDFN